MADFRYPKPLRFPINDGIKYKRRLTDDDMRYLLSGRVAVEEKMDGKEKILKAGHFIICAEDMMLVHSVSYRIPRRFAVFDVFDEKRGLFLGPEGKADVVEFLQRTSSFLPKSAAAGIFLVKKISEGKFSIDQLNEMLDMLSDYAITLDGQPGYMEGIVIKPARELFYEEHISGKLIRSEFEEGMGTHYLREPRRLNAINPVFALSEGRQL